MNKLLLITMVAMISIAASVTTTTMIVKPARPIDIKIVYVHFGNEKKILEYSKQGYLVKAFHPDGIYVIMEKY